ncbi:MAG: acylneuraminate cytidylyltransferase family protein [Bacteroidales bacterium]|nr:acylneuraminate cytidylyltransferase family protein [Bacteroidales bacterium]
MKAHSERVPNKNMRLLHGKPLYHAVAEALSQSPYIDEILINTDSTKIAEDSARYFPKIRIIDRPVSLQGDFVPMNDIIAYDLSQSQTEHFIQTHSTNPLLTTESINRGIEMYFANLDKHDSVFSVTRLQTRLYWKDGSAINHNPAELLRTQDLPPVYEENSCFYIFSKKSFVSAANKRIGLRPLMTELDKLEAVDIDEPADFIMAETLYKLKRANEI